MPSYAVVIVSSSRVVPGFPFVHGMGTSTIVLVCGQGPLVFCVAHSIVVTAGLAAFCHWITGILF